MSAFVAGFFNMGNIQADVIDGAGTLNFDNRAYVHAIHNAPNPAESRKVEFAKIAYADKAYGQAIFSYPSNVAFQETAFNVEYVDTAYGQAIYNYPNNNTVKPHLELSAETQSPADKFIVPAAFKGIDKTNTTANP
jgi:hypothetical protein